MIEKMKRVINVICKPRLFKQLISMGTKGYLYDIGWIHSFEKRMPIDQNGNPLPWVTYSFINFIENRLDKTMDIFEYGVGNSTLWYSKRVNSVISVEHDKKWFEKMRQLVPNNVKIYYQSLENENAYSKFPSFLKKKFDIIIIDGRERVNCIKNSINFLKKGGIIVLDDSERLEYKEGINFLLENGYKKIDLWGISPGTFYNKCTTIFYKEKNCIGI